MADPHSLPRFLPRILLCALPVALALTLGPALAQSGDAPAETPTEAATGADGIRIELNRLDPQPGACRISLVTENASDQDVERLVLEAVGFNRDGQVAAITLLDLQGLPAGRMRVRSFDLPGLDCEGLGRLLINDSTCAPADAAICARPLRLGSLVEVEVRQ